MFEFESETELKREQNSVIVELMCFQFLLNWKVSLDTVPRYY